MERAAPVLLSHTLPCSSIGEEEAVMHSFPSCLFLAKGTGGILGSGELGIHAPIFSTLAFFMLIDVTVVVHTKVNRR